MRAWPLIVATVLMLPGRVHADSGLPSRGARLFLSAAYGGGQVTNRYGALSGKAINLSLGASDERTVMRLDYLAVDGNPKLSHELVRHSFLGAVVERWNDNRLFASGGLGFSTLSYNDIPHRGVGVSLGVGGVPFWIADVVGVTVQMRFMGGVHRHTLHLSGGALLGLALR